MSYPFNQPVNMPCILALAPQHGTAAPQSATPVCLKNVLKLWAHVFVNTSASSGAVTLTPQTDALIAFGSAAALANVVPIWGAVDNATSPLLAEKTAAVNYVTAADAFFKHIVFEIDPANLTAGELCFRITSTVAAADWWCVYYEYIPRYAATTPIDVLAD